MTRRKLITSIAALAAAGAIAAVPASASAQSVPIAYAPPYAFCQGLVNQIQFATTTGNPVLASAIRDVFVYSHCGGAAI